MSKKREKNIHELIKERFGTNKLWDEEFSSKTHEEQHYSDNFVPSPSAIRANPDLLSDNEESPWPPKEVSEDHSKKLEALRNVRHILKGKELEVYSFLLKYPYTGIQLAEKLGVSQQRISAILQRIRQKVHKNFYKNYGSKS